MITIRQVLWIMGWLLYVTADDQIVNRHFKKMNTSLDSNSYLYGITVNATSLLRCTSLCSVQQCGCVSHAYNVTTKTCILFSIALESQLLGNDVVYVDTSGCCSVPYVENAYGIVNYTSNGTAFDYICDPDLYISLGDPAMTCSWETGQWSSIQFQCKDGWKCVHADLLDHIIALFPWWSYYDACIFEGNRYTGGYDTRAPGCGRCLCCKRK